MPQLLNEVATAPAQNCQRMVLLGSAKVGKTAIVSRFLSNCFDEKYTPTIEDFHRKVYRIRGESYRLDILDTSGNNPFPAMKRLSLLTGFHLFCYFIIYSFIYIYYKLIFSCSRQRKPAPLSRLWDSGAVGVNVWTYLLTYLHDGLLKEYSMLSSNSAGD